MQTDTGFTFETAMGEICQGVIETVADRPGDSEAKRFARHQTTAWTMMSMRPRDPLETMLAGHCVIFDHMLREGARDLLRGQSEQIRLRARPQVHASGKLFIVHLDKFEQMARRPADQLAVRAPAAGPEPADEAPPNVADEAPANVAEPVPAEAATAAAEPSPAPLNRQQRRYLARAGQPAPRPADPRANTQPAAPAPPWREPEPERMVGQPHGIDIGNSPDAAAVAARDGQPAPAPFSPTGQILPSPRTFQPTRAEELV